MRVVVRPRDESLDLMVRYGEDIDGVSHARSFGPSPGSAAFAGQIVA
jgi:hypothetical protein